MSTLLKVLKRGTPDLGMQDYTGVEVTVENFFAVLLGDKSAVRGGSGKVVDSKAGDHIFIYYTDHGGPGVLGMPNMPNLFARDFIETLRLKHAAGTYKELVIREWNVSTTCITTTTTRCQLL